MDKVLRLQQIPSKLIQNYLAQYGNQKKDIRDYSYL